jgi:hypothetical protein
MPAELRSGKKMEKMDALYKYWQDPNYIVVEAGQPELTIDWLTQQTPDTWHSVVMTWNYDFQDKVLSWVLDQEDCDKGTAARVFEIEGRGHWLGDEKLATDENQLCSIILRNWGRYRSGELDHNPKDQKAFVESAQKHVGNGVYADTPILEVAQYSGTRVASSEFESQDGKVVVAFDHWLETNGIKISN